MASSRRKDEVFLAALLKECQQRKAQASLRRSHLLGTSITRVGIYYEGQRESDELGLFEPETLQEKAEAWIAKSRRVRRQTERKYIHAMRKAFERFPKNNDWSGYYRVLKEIESELKQDRSISGQIVSAYLRFHFDGLEFWKEERDRRVLLEKDLKAMLTQASTKR